MIWNIVTDSSCDLKELEAGTPENQLRFHSVPFIISVDSQDFVDDEHVDIGEMLDTMEASRNASRTSCPSPTSWEEAFQAEGNVLAVTISKELSGSYSSACVARQMVLETNPDKKIFVINSFSAGTGLVCLVRLMIQEIMSGRSFEEVSQYTQRMAEQMRTIFALCSFDNLIKNGRMPKLLGMLAQSLNFWGVGVATPEGKIDIKSKVRGTKRILAAFLDDMLERGKPEFGVFISHCQNEELALKLQEEIRKRWEDVKVEILNTRALCSYYAERHGLIVAYL